MSARPKNPPNRPAKILQKPGVLAAIRTARNHLILDTIWGPSQTVLTLVYGPFYGPWSASPVCARVQRLTLPSGGSGTYLNTANYVNVTLMPETK